VQLRGVVDVQQKAVIQIAEDDRVACDVKLLSEEHDELQATLRKYMKRT
jgi:hypothetical protein